MFYDHAWAMLNGKDVDYDEEPEPLEFEGVKIDEQGRRVYSK